jgi:lysyl-tRNA synthetase class 1
MLAQIKSSDEDVWASLRKSGHLDEEPSEALSGRLHRMRNWVDGQHFPSAAKVEVQSRVSDGARANLTDEHRGFLSSLSDELAECEWTSEAIGGCIRSVASEVGIDGRDAYIALYWVILGKSHGPKAASIIAEMESEDFIALANSTRIGTS